MSQFYVLELFQGNIGLLLALGIFTVGLVLWLLIPLYDAKSQNSVRARRATYFGLAVVLFLLVTTILAYHGVYSKI
jgi:cytochrome b6